MIKSGHLIFIMLWLLQSCVEVKQPILDDSAQLAIPEGKESGMSALRYKGGSIDDFQEDIEDWNSTSEGILLVKNLDTFKVLSTFSGDKYGFFSRKVPPLDFSTATVIKIRAKADGPSSPLLQLALKDYKGIIAHDPPVGNKILNDGKFRDYYFDFKDKWRQSYPDNQNVDSSLITEVLFFINPGGPEYNGYLFIQEVRAVNVAKNNRSNLKIIDNFEGRGMEWWTHENIKIQKLEGNKNSLEITSEGVGPDYENFGREFEKKDMSRLPIVKVRARSIPEEGEKEPDLRIDLKDGDGKITNASPVVQKIEASSKFKDYYFSFKDNFYQMWPDSSEVSMKDITGVTCFINAGGDPYNGKIIIESLDLISEVQYNEILKKEAKKEELEKETKGVGSREN